LKPLIFATALLAVEDKPNVIKVETMVVQIVGALLLVPCEFHIQCMPMKIGVKQARQED